jgi:hypothetical protein
VVVSDKIALEPDRVPGPALGPARAPRFRPPMVIRRHIITASHIRRDRVMVFTRSDLLRARSIL